jgi:hypothetical protein
MVGTAKEETMENAKGRIVIAFTVLILGISNTMNAQGRASDTP